MRKLLSIFLFSILTVSLSAQIIDETIPKFGEKLISMKKVSAKNDIAGRGFKLLSTDDMRTFGYTTEEIKRTIVGMGDYGIICKIETDENSNIKKVYVTAQYTDIRSMMNEYTKEGYTFDEEWSKGGNYMYRKVVGKYLYVVNLEFANSPTSCTATMQMQRIQPDYLK
ncbi:MULTISPECIES: hypothetical protein [Parabacteroides]|uniref:hypothetical protein n=1 Tax=Parabacteroides leei TaxID=2939491 RepID=UPI001899C8FE|nr:hypothetical protein [Parabacteroides goldsteinii]